MAEHPPLYALLAEFDAPELLVKAAKEMHAQGFRRIEAFTPYPVEGLAEAIGFSEHRVPPAMLIGGVIGAVAGFLMQVGATLDFPLWVGGRPLVAVPAFMLITFELTVLGAVLGCIGTMLALNRLPRLNHPMFDADRFSLASDDRFFLALLPGKDFDRDAAGKALAALHPQAIIDVPGRPER